MSFNYKLTIACKFLNKSDNEQNFTSLITINCQNFEVINISIIKSKIIALKFVNDEINQR